MWDSEADILYPHTVTLRSPGVTNIYGRPRSDDDDFGEDTFGSGDFEGGGGGSPLTRKALIEYKMRLIRDVKGQQTMSSTTVYLNGAAGVLSITSDWTIVLPSGESRPILSVDRYADEDGDEFEVLHLQ